MSDPRRPYIVAEKDSASLLASNVASRDTPPLRIYALLSRRALAAVNYLSGWITLTIWTNQTFPEYTFLTVGLALLTTGILLGYEQ